MSATAKDMLIRELKDMLHSQQQLNATLQALNSTLQAQVAEMTIQIKLLNEQIEYLKRKLFGTSSEKKKVEELIPSDTEPDEILTVEEIPVKSHTRKKKKSLEEKIKNLPVEVVEIVLKEEDCFCENCGSKLEVIGKEVIRRQVEYIPASLKVIEYVQVRYGCPVCKQTEEPYFAMAPVPPGLMKHSIASPSLVGFIIYQKFANGLPLYRQEKD